MEFAPLLFWVHVKKNFLFKIFLDKAAPPPSFKQKTMPPSCTQSLYYFPSQGYMCELYLEI